MSQIHISNLTFSYEGSFDNIFENVSFSVDTDWKLGLVGRNGKGKTTFLNLLLGNHEYAGTISTSAVFDYFPYHITREQLDRPAAEFAEELKTQAEPWRVICELAQLCESAEILYRPFRTLSPGERTKILLAILFSGENDFLLIDEPTNHLDRQSREQVKGYLAQKKGFILVSHDRDLLDACIDHVLVLNRKTIEVQSGNFSSWWENKQRKDQFAQTENEKHLKEIGKLKQAAARSARWADKNENTKIGIDPVKDHDRGCGTRPYIGAKTKKMQSRVKQLEHRINREIEEKEGLLADLEQIADLKLTPLIHHKETLVNIRDYGVGYNTADQPVFTGLTFTVKRGQRIALHGENGCGKSTLIRMILQKTGMMISPAKATDKTDFISTRNKTTVPAKNQSLYPHKEQPSVSSTVKPKTEPIDTPALTTPVNIIESGCLETASGLIVSYINQDTSWLRGDISRFCEERQLDKSLFCSILRQLGLERIQFVKNIADYSEGQKKKILIAASLLTPAHLYVWDEPLNYIDVFSRMQIEKLLLDYKPTMVFVEHDTRFRERIATEVVAL